jgi:hypothetical protein
MPTCSVCGKKFPKEKLVECENCGRAYCEECEDFASCSECGRTFCGDCADTSMRALGLCSDCEEVWQAEEDLDAEEKQGEEVLKPAECPRCKFVNPAGAKFCMRCSMVLDSREAKILDDRLKHADHVQVLLVRYPVEHAPEMLEEILKQPEIKQELEKALSDGGGN